MDKQTYFAVAGVLFSLTLGMGCVKKASQIHNNSQIMGNSFLTTSPKEFTAVADWLKSSVEMVPHDRLNHYVQKHCTRLKLVDTRGQWKVAGLAAHQDRICPREIKKVQLNQLIDESMMHLQDNPMLSHFLEDAKGDKVSGFTAKISKSRGIHVGELVVWAYVLEQITALELKEPKYIRVLYDHWVSERQKEGFKPPQNINNVFGAIKLASVEKPISDIIGFFEKCQSLDPKFAKGFLPLNIFEAIAADRLMGHRDNSEAGWPLFNNAPGASPNQILGTGPATFSKDNQKIEIRMTLPKQWADLYQVWNMAFVSQVDDAPFWWVKLLIPSVSAYKAAPEEYIYRRVLALYTSLIHGGLLSKEYLEGSQERINWSDKDLTELWGKTNKRASDSYQAVVNAAKN